VIGFLYGALVGYCYSYPPTFFEVLKTAVFWPLLIRRG